MKIFLIALILFWSFSLYCQNELFGIPVIAHSHNDYKQNSPLTTAIDNNFASIEIDIFEHNGEIVVAHDEEELNESPTIEDLYFNRIFSSHLKHKHFILLIDINL